MQVFSLPLQDPEVFSDLYDRTQIIIFRFIYGLHGGPLEEVEDLTCDTFLRAWKSRHRFTGDEHAALCWLFTIARRLVIDEHRHKMAHSEYTTMKLDDTNVDAMIESARETTEDKATAREQFQHLWHILQVMPDDKREMLVLRYMLGWKVKEIAAFMQKEENTISVTIKRSLEDIRQKWSGE